MISIRRALCFGRNNYTSITQCHSSGYVDSNDWYNVSSIYTPSVQLFDDIHLNRNGVLLVESLNTNWSHKLDPQTISSKLVSNRNNEIYKEGE